MAARAWSLTEKPGKTIAKAPRCSVGQFIEANLGAGTLKRAWRSPLRASISKWRLTSAPSSSATSATILAVKFVRGIGTEPFWVGLSQMSPPGVAL